MSRQEAKPDRTTGLKINRDILSAGYIPTPDEISRLFGPARTLGGPPEKREEMILAADSSLRDHGAYNLVSHALEMGQSLGVGGQFMGYPALSSLSQNGLVSACVTTVADDMTRAWVDIRLSDDEDNGGNSFSANDLKREMDKFKLREIFHQAAVLTGYFGGCLIFIDTGVRGEALKTPLNVSELSEELKGGGLRGFTIIEPINVFPGHYNSHDPLSADYYIPRSWWVLSREVHASRLIRVSSDMPPVLLRPSYNFFGIPHAQIIYDYVLHFQECRMAAQELLTKFSLTALKTDMSGLLSGGAADELERRSAYFVQKRGNDGLMMIDKDSEDIIKLETPLTGVTDIVKQSLEFVAAVNRTPAVKLLGISPSGFNATGESDLRNYYDHVESQAQKILRPGLTRALEVLQINSFGNIDPGLDVEFLPLSEDDRLARANVSKLEAETAEIYCKLGALSPDEIREHFSTASGSDCDPTTGA